MKRSKFDVPAANECPDCRGTGHTAKDAPVTSTDAKGTFTVKQGSGCERCLGIGRLETTT